VVDRDWAPDFRAFCTLNPTPCPLLDQTGTGSPHPLRLAPDADIRSDLPGYWIHEQGRVTRVEDLRSHWRDDLVAFLLGCSFSFEHALMRAGIGIRHLEQRVTVPMYVTNLECRPVGRLSGPMVVSMRPLRVADLERVFEICAQFPGAHGEPVHVGDPAAIGIADLNQPDFGEPVPLRSGEVPAFWGCGVTPQVVLARSGCPWFASHEPGRMFVSDAMENVLPL
jgi:uncharacterized protein YcsI (UPF0317 family)